MNRVQVIDAALKEADIELSSKGYTRFVTRLYYRAREIAPKARVPFSREYRAYSPSSWTLLTSTADLYKELLRLEIADLKSSGCLSLLSSSDESSADVPMLDSQAVDSIDKRDIDEPVPLPSLQVAENPALVKLEAAVQKAIEVLEHLKQGLENTDRAIWMKDTDWVAEITKTLEHAVPAKVVIGVVGSTGAGKSSVINAVVDEENVLATNCMRASTAVATEISYNHGDSKYAAEIEFITPDEWHKELQILFSDISDCQDEVACNNVRKDSEVAVALQRVLAVYPKYDRKSILLASVAELMRDKGVTEFLGTTTTIEENDPKIFSDALALYFDSKPTKEQLRRQRRRLAGSAKGGVAAQSPTPSPASPALGRGMRLWPLIRVVRVYLKAEALSTGATLVDLPGVFDSNPGRVQVAEDYMKKCSAHWVVAPINRAVDDKVAQDLLDKNLKVQLQMDCAFNGISFICTKTDDISISEVQATLDFEPPSSKKRDKREEELKAATNELADAHFKKAEAYEQLQKIKRRIAKLEATIDRSGAPAASLPSPSKTGQAPQATADISVGEKLAHYKEQMKEINSQYITHRDQTEPLQERLDELQLEIPRIETDILREYIEARNSYAKGEIREDFAAEIREPDQEEFEDISEMQAIDYSKLEKDLPVFCVSSRAYQKLRGRLCREPGIDGFTTLADTEIFHLQKHCISLTEKAREASAREFLTNANLLLQSIGIWSSAANPSQALPDEDIHEIKARFSNEASKLKHVNAPVPATYHLLTFS